ncbi:hypothetical protein SLA2020_245630 [Shorea laevis]
MPEVANLPIAEKDPRKRKLGKKKSGKKNKKLKMLQGNGEKFKVSKKMQKLFRKRAREYHSDEDDDDDELVPVTRGENAEDMEMGGSGSSDEGEDREDLETDNGNSDGEEDDEIQPGIMKFTEGCRAFRMAFKNIVKRNVSNDSLGPVLSGHKQLIAKKLAQEETERKVKGEAKKEKHMVAEKGHVKPLTYLDLHEKFLISVATKGVVKLFNAVNKAQNAQKGLNPSRSKDAKVIKKRRKEAFFSELGKTSLQAPDAANKDTSSAPVNEGPAWAPLRDNFMVTNPKLKDWDKMPDAAVTDDIGRMSEDSGSEDD